MHDEPDMCACDHIEGPRSEAYNEEAFRYFLDIERRRSEISSRPFLLMLVDLKEQRGAGSQIPHAAAVRLFKRLALCLRETDFVGWYREERVAGAVLTQRPDTPSTDASQQVVERVRQALGEEFESDVSRLQVRIYQIPPIPARELQAREGQA
jgi:GGDEF domain-containing protein